MEDVRYTDDERWKSVQLNAEFQSILVNNSEEDLWHDESTATICDAGCAQKLKEHEHDSDYDENPLSAVHSFSSWHVC